MKNTALHTLSCALPFFLAEQDEILFFERLSRITAIKDFTIEDDTLSLKMKTVILADQDLNELLSLFYRYQMNMSAFSVFLNESNKEWFYDNPKAHWHKEIFREKL